MTLHGVLVVDKPAGMTSAQVVARVKKALGAAAVGHTGTLDPMATGVLPVVLGEGTKLAAFLQADDKVYQGELELGYTTDTLDREGKELSRGDWHGVDEAAVAGAMAALTGELEQLPPMYSAIKQDGQPLYKLARAGVEVERAARHVRVDRFAITGCALPRVQFEVACSKGTYVRSLTRDLGVALGCGATLTALRRTRAGRLGLDRALALAEVTPEAAAARLVSPPDAIAHLPALALSEIELARVGHGKTLLAPESAQVGTVYRALTIKGALAAVLEAKEGAGGKLTYLRVFNYGR